MQSDLFLLLAAGGVAVFGAVVFHFGRLTERRQHRIAGSPTLTAIDVSRLSDAVDAMALEIERIGENQRYLTRLLTAESVEDKLR